MSVAHQNFKISPAQTKLVLKAPKSGECPKRLPRVRAFTGLPPAKPKPFKPETEEEDGQRLKAEAPSTKTAVNDALVAWLREAGDKRGYAEAREYLLAGAPYKGESGFGAKDQLKDNGAKWIPNPLKEKGVRDGMTGGWWSALAERDLKTLMSLTHAKESRYGKPSNVVPSWRPLGVPEESASRVLMLLSQFEAHVEDVQQRQAVERAAAAAPSKKDAHARTAHDTPPDRPEDVAAMQSEFGIAWTEELKEQSRRVYLGPRSGLSDSLVVLRGLRLKVVTPEAVLSSQWVQPQHAMKRHRGGAADAATVAEPVDYRKQRITRVSAGCFMFGKGERMIPLPNQGEWDRMSEELKANDLKLVRTLPEGHQTTTTRATYCTGCVRQVFEQFLDCSCGRVWSVCSTCHYLRCDAQPCKCCEDAEDADESKRGAWHRAQNTTHRVYCDTLQAADLALLHGEAGYP